MLNPEQAEDLAKKVIQGYLIAANPLVPGDTEKLLTKLIHVAQRAIPPKPNAIKKKSMWEAGILK